jgi:hypothetical protein
MITAAADVLVYDQHFRGEDAAKLHSIPNLGRFFDKFRQHAESIWM